jgi:hypothetical protein
MVSFYKLCESMHRSPGQDFWQSPEGTDGDQDDQVADDAIEMVQRGLEIRPDRTDGNTFWDDFITVIGNNPDAASKLFGVSREHIAKWSRKIKETIKQVRQDNISDEDKRKKKSEMLPTGN